MTLFFICRCISDLERTSLPLSDDWDDDGYDDEVGQSYDSIGSPSGTSREVVGGVPTIFASFSDHVSSIFPIVSETISAQIHV